MKSQYYHKVFLFTDIEYWKQFCSSQTAMSLNKKIMILSSYKLQHNNPNIVFYQIEKAEQQLLCSLYYLYEFSNYFVVISQENSLFPDLECFLKTDILSREEIWQSMLY